MSLDMFDADAIAEAVRLLVQGRVALTGDCDGCDAVVVGSTELFREGPGRPAYPIRDLGIRAVLLPGDDGPFDVVTIREISSRTTLRLAGVPSRAYLADSGASIRLDMPPAQLHPEAVVGFGRPEVVIDPVATPLPTMTISLRKGEMSSDGGNRVYRQRHFIDVYYVRRKQAGEAAGVEQRRTLQTLVNLLMEDMYLGGTCGTCWVSGWDFEVPPPDRHGWAAIDISRVELTAEAWKLWDK